MEYLMRHMNTPTLNRFLLVLWGSTLLFSCSSPTSGTTKTVPQLTALSLSPSTVTLNTGGQYTLTAQGTFSDGSSASVTPSQWTTSNASVATVNQGHVTGVSAGTCTITAVDNSLSASTTVTVQAIPSTLAPLPTVTANNALMLWNSGSTYTNKALGNWNPNWGQQSSLSDATIAGKTVKLLSLVNYQGIDLSGPNGASTDTSPAPWNATGMTTLHLSYWTHGGTVLSVDLINATTETFATAGATVTFTNLAQDKWTDLEVPIPTGFDVTTLRQIKFTNETVAGSNTFGTPANFYLDNIYFHTSTTNTSTTLSSTDDPWYGGTLLWDDEFNGNSINPANWAYDLGNNGGWGNNELETYTSSNASIQNVTDGNSTASCLVLTAQKDTNGNWTSARLKTEGLQNFTYGKIEARIKLPYGNGMWPAFWMLGSDINSVGWPACGETDILEMIGGTGTSSTSGSSLSDSKVYGTIHWLTNNTKSNASYQPEIYTLSSGKFADAFHTFGVIWTSTSITYYIDGQQTAYVSPDSTTGTIFQQPFFLILNLAVGGTWPGPPNSSTVSPQTMDVDWVRVYQ